MHGTDWLSVHTKLYIFSHSTSTMQITLIYYIDQWWLAWWESVITNIPSPTPNPIKFHTSGTRIGRQKLLHPSNGTAFKLMYGLVSLLWCPCFGPKVVSLALMCQYEVGPRQPSVSVWNLVYNLYCLLASYPACKFVYVCFACISAEYVQIQTSYSYLLCSNWRYKWQVCPVSS